MSSPPPIRGNAFNFSTQSWDSVPAEKTGEEIIDVFKKTTEQVASEGENRGSYRELADKHIDSLNTELLKMKELGYSGEKIQEELEALVDVYHGSLARHLVHLNSYSTERYKEEEKNISLTQRIAQTTFQAIRFNFAQESGILLIDTPIFEPSEPDRIDKLPPIFEPSKPDRIANLPQSRTYCDQSSGICLQEITAVPVEKLPHHQIDKALDRWDENQVKVRPADRPKYVKKLEEARDHLLKEEKEVERLHDLTLSSYCIKIKIEQIDSEIEEEFKPRRQFTVKKDLP